MIKTANRLSVLTDFGFKNLLACLVILIYFLPMLQNTVKASGIIHNVYVKYFVKKTEKIAGHIVKPYGA